MPAVQRDITDRIRFIARESPDALLACPGCDALYRRPDLPPGARARCRRCGSIVWTRKHFVAQRLLASVVSSAMLLVAAVSFPFLSLSTAGISKSASLIEAVLSLSRGGLWIAMAALALVVGIPLLRITLQIYVLGPIAFARSPAPGAARMYRYTTALRPWAMAEVFTLGVLVAMIKLGSFAHVSVGPAFVALLALVFVVAYESLAHCESTLWTQLGTS